MESQQQRNVLSQQPPSDSEVTSDATEWQQVPSDRPWGKVKNLHFSQAWKIFENRIGR